MFIEMQRHPRFDAVDFSRLKLLISGGAPCPPPVFERFFARGVDFETGYGLTEAGPNNFWLPAEDVRRKPGSVGVPLFHVEARIDGEQQPGDVGELLLRGPHLCAGYWRRPEETARDLRGRLAAHRGPRRAATRTGASASWAGSKDLIISGGENIYPAEVESVLAAPPRRRRGRRDRRARPEVGRGAARARRRAARRRASRESLLAFCEGRLARYKQPRSVRFLAPCRAPRRQGGPARARGLRTATRESRHQGRRLLTAGRVVGLASDRLPVARKRFRNISS